MVFIKDVSANADAGTASRWGGNDINYLDDYFDNVDITPKLPRINTATYFRSGKFAWRNPADTFQYNVVAGAITANRNINIPVLTSDDTLVFLGLANTFTGGEQTIQGTGSDLLSMYRENNSVGNGPNLKFYANNSSGVKTDYGRFRIEVAVNTAGAEYGKANVRLTRNATTFVKVAEWDENGDYAFGANMRVKLTESGQTSQSTFKFPNVNSTISGVVAQSGTTVDTHTTSAEFDLLNYSVPGNAIGTNGSIRFTITGYILQDDAATATYTFRIKFGGTNMYQDVTAAVPDDAGGKRAVRITGEIFNKNATNAQGASMIVAVSDVNGATTGIGDISDDESFVLSAVDSEGADQAKDTTSSQTLQITCQMSVSSASTHFVTKHTLVEILPGT